MKSAASPAAGLPGRGQAEPADAAEHAADVLAGPHPPVPGQLPGRFQVGQVVQERLDVTAAEGGGQLAVVIAGGVQVCRQPRHRVDDLPHPGMRPVAAVPGQVVGGPPFDGLAQPALAEAGERQLPPEEPNTVRSQTSLAVSAVVSPSPARTWRASECRTWLFSRVIGPLTASGLQRGGPAPAQVLSHRPQHVQPGGDALTGPLLQAVEHLGGQQRRKPAQADLPAHRDRRRLRPPAFLVEPAAVLTAGNAQLRLVRLAVPGAAGPIPRAGRHLARADRRQRTSLRAGQEHAPAAGHR